MINNIDMRALPSFDALLNSEEGKTLVKEIGEAKAKYALHTALCSARNTLLQGEQKDISYTALADNARAVWDLSVSPKRVINASGIALHTNLGRAPLSKRAIDAVINTARYSALEYDLERGERGVRGKDIEKLICTITNTEAAMVVNNNAAALLLALTALCRDKGTIVSRGELVEIGGSFRVSDITALGSCLIEVGTTNRTHLQDYSKAVNEAGAVLKVHTSNYTVNGFTASVSAKELAKLCHTHDIPLIYDVGSGAIMDKSEYPFFEPTVVDAVKDEADIITFSADKLLGAAQGGIICGKRKYIDIMRAHPLARAVRIDKLALAAIGATLELYRDNATAKLEIPVLQMLTASDDKLLSRARLLQKALGNIKSDIIPSARPVGGGSVPCVELTSYCVAVATLLPKDAADALRKSAIPIIALVRDNKLCLDVACIFDDEIDIVAQEVKTVL